MIIINVIQKKLIKSALPMNWINGNIQYFYGNVLYIIIYVIIYTLYIINLLPKIFLKGKD